MNLILLNPFEVSESRAVIPLNDDRAKHITKHLRKKTGDSVSVGVLGGAKYSAQLTLPDTNDESSRLILILGTPQPVKNEPPITIILALPFPARLKYLWSVMASMGVHHIVIIRAQLSDPEHAKAKAVQPDTYQKLLKEGLSQGGHTHMPQVDIHVENETIDLELLKNYTTKQEDPIKIFLDCGDEEIVPPLVGKVVKRQLRKDAITPSAIVAIGPERGWTDAEADLFRKAGFQSALLGSSVLRVDTAVVAGIAQVQAALQDIDGS